MADFYILLGHLASDLCFDIWEAYVHVYTKSDMAHEGGEQEKWILILDIRAVIDLGFSSWCLCCIIISCDGFSLINIWYL